MHYRRVAKGIWEEHIFSSMVPLVPSPRLHTVRKWVPLHILETYSIPLPFWYGLSVGISDHHALYAKKLKGILEKHIFSPLVPLVPIPLHTVRKSVPL
jgi:hypothetical protein